MKKILFLSFWLIFSFSLFSQNYVYCEIVGISNPVSLGKEHPSKAKLDELYINFGSEDISSKDKELKDENGKPIKLMIDAMNYLSADGWEFVNSYAVQIASMKGQRMVHYYILRKENK